MASDDFFKNSPLHDKSAIINMLDKLEPRQMVEVISYIQNLAQNITNIIERLNIRVMFCRSGDGLMSYGYSFIQIGGYKGQSYDDVKGSEIWNGDYTGFSTVLDCRNGKCIKITIDELKKIIDLELFQDKLK